MLFGLKNAPGTFQRAMFVILSTVKLQVVLIYLDNIVDLLKFTEAKLRQVRHVLTLLHDAGHTIELKKRKLVFNSTN